MLSTRANNILYNMFIRAGYELTFKDVEGLSSDETLKRLEKVRAKKYPSRSIEGMLERQSGCGGHTRQELLNWLGVKPHADKSIEDLRQEISDMLSEATHDQVRAMWRALRRTTS